MQRVLKPIVLNVLICIFCYGTLNAQSSNNTPQAKSKIKISGNFIVATDFQSVFTLYGGPAIKFDFSKNLYVSISMYPSLRWKNDPAKPTILPMLGTGLHIGYKSFILALPFYYISSENKWKAAPGVGIRF